MNEVLQSAFAFIIVLGVLITFHEFGHYWVAKRCHVKILRFSIGFGKPIYKRTFGADKTEFVISALPLGGYVKMLGESKAEVNAAEQCRSFSHKPLWQRVAIVSAGPLFNFIFAVLTYWIIFIIGIHSLKPIIGEVIPNSISARAGFEQGQEIISVNGETTLTWATLGDRFIHHIVNSDIIEIKLKDNDGIVTEAKLDLSNISIDDMTQDGLLEVLGLKTVELKLPAIIGKIMPGQAADKSGLAQYDEIITTDDVPINSWSEWVQIIQDNPDKTITVELLRNGELMTLQLTPKSVKRDGKTIGRLGAVAFTPENLFDEYFTRESYSLFSALGKSISKTWEMSMLTLRVIGKILVGGASLKNLSGPISIALYAGESAGIGLISFLGFMAILSVNLGVLNLLPIPLLDGGHLMYYLVEYITGKPISEAAQVYAQQLGLFILFSLMIIVFYNDIIRLLE